MAAPHSRPPIQVALDEAEVDFDQVPLHAQAVLSFQIDAAPGHQRGPKQREFGEDSSEVVVEAHKHQQEAPVALVPIVAPHAKTMIPSALRQFLEADLKPAAPAAMRGLVPASYQHHVANHFAHNPRVCLQVRERGADEGSHSRALHFVARVLVFRRVESSHQRVGRSGAHRHARVGHRREV